MNTVATTNSNIDLESYLVLSLRVELERFSLRPVAWWVRYSKHKQERILKALGSPESKWGKSSRVGSTDVFVTAADIEALEQHPRLVLSLASGRKVLVESEQELTVDKVRERMLKMGQSRCILNLLAGAF